MSLRIAIKCCNYLSGEGIKRLIEDDELDIDAIFICSNTKEIIEANPNLVITDFNTLFSILFNMPSEHNMRFFLLGTGCLPKIESKCLFDFMSKGLVGILSPTSSSLQLKKAIKSVLSGDVWLDQNRLQDIFSSTNGISTKKIPVMTKRETEIVNLICQGSSNKEIMKELSIGEQCVKAHLNRIYKKTGTSDRLQLALFTVKAAHDLTHSIDHCFVHCEQFNS